MTTDDTYMFQDDGLETPEIGQWGITKHEKIEYYSSVFASSMKNKWDCRLYIDLYAGAGKSRIKDSEKIVPGSPLIALNVDCTFDKYIFCEKVPSNMDALQKRVIKYFPTCNVSYVCNDINDSLDELFSYIPNFNSSYKGLALCFVDPFKMGELDFKTLKIISEKLYVDFLVLIPSYMDIHRNKDTYTLPNNNALDTYLGTDKWREDWEKNKKPYEEFGMFITEKFCSQMKNLGFLYEGNKDLVLVKANLANQLRLYHLGFFSKSPLGLKFWRDTKKNTEKQLRLF